MLIAAKDHSGSNFPWLAPNGPVTPPFASDDPEQPDVQPDSAGGTVPIFFDNNGNGTYQAGIDVPYDNRFVTGGTYTNYATYINDGLSTPSPLFQGGTTGANTDLFKPYVMEPVNRLDSWDYSVNLDWQISDNVSLLYVIVVPRIQEHVRRGHRRLAARGAAAAASHGSRADDAGDSESAWRPAIASISRSAPSTSTRKPPRMRASTCPTSASTSSTARTWCPRTTRRSTPTRRLQLTDRLDLSLGLRHSEDEKSYTFRRRNPDLTAVQPCAVHPGLGFPNPWFWEAANPPNCGVFGLDLLSVAYSSDNTDWRVALSADIGDASMVYGQIATGYKAGGNNARPFFPSQLNAFQPETLDSYEVGFKTTLGGNVRMNAAIFWNDYVDIQLPTTSCTWAPPGQQTPCASQNNVGDADVWGIEFETEWHPTDSLMIDASVQHAGLRVSTIIPGATAVTLGMITPYTPETKVSIGMQNRFSLGGGGTLTPRLDVNYTDEMYSNAVNAPTNFIDDVTLVNARLTWDVGGRGLGSGDRRRRTSRTSTTT